MTNCIEYIFVVILCSIPPFCCCLYLVSLPLSTSERLDRFGEFIVLAHTADRDVYYHPFHALAWPFLRAPTAFRLIAHVGEKYARECAFRPTLAALPKTANDNAHSNADGTSGGDESGDSGSGDDGGSDGWMRPAFHRSIVDTLVSLPTDASHVAVPDGAATDHHPGYSFRSAASTGSAASSTASTSSSTSATASSASSSSSSSSSASDSSPLAARLRVGYLSADLHVSHPVGVLAHSLFAMHDRTRFEVHCLSLRRVPRDPFQRAWGADDREDSDERAKKNDASENGSGSTSGSTSGSSKNTSGKGRAATDTGSIESSQCTAPHASNHSDSPSSNTAQPTTQPCDLRCEHWHSLDALDAAELFALLHTRLRLHIIVDLIGYCLHHRASGMYTDVVWHDEGGL
jgi:hypothetical protein